jgi:argininosuccinate synthase
MTSCGNTGQRRRIVLAYSGSVPATVAIGWLADRYDAEVVTVTLDLGQGAGLEAVHDQALSAGAVRAHVIDAREEFARDFIVPALRACAIRDDGHPLVTALSRPIIAKHLVEIAHLEEASAVAHGCHEDDARDARRMETLLHALNPGLVVLAPVREWSLTEAEVTRRAKMRGLVLPSTIGAAVDANLWGRTADLEQSPDTTRTRETYVLTRPPSKAPDGPADVELAFEEGIPVAVNGVALPLVELISSIETIAGSHGVGRFEAAGDVAAAGLSVTIEAPAAVVLHEAHRALQRSVMPPDEARRATDRSADYVDLVASGDWYTARREEGDLFVAGVQKHVTGTARLRLFKGRSEVIECRSPFALANGRPVDRAADAAAART